MMKDSVYIIDVGPRDGLQNINTFIPTEIKAEFIHQIIDAGIKELEVTSFVSPKSIPQLSDAEKLMNLVGKREGVIFSCLVPTMKGLERAIKSSVKKVVFFVAASEEFNKKNLNSSIKNTLENFKDMKKFCDEKGIEVKASISTSFHCPFTGYINPDKVIKIIEALASMGIKEFILCDTTGTATPKEVEKLLIEVEKSYDLGSFGLHMHNTYGFALVSIYRAFEMGIRKFEASTGGFGGCPNAPGATGNIATEVLCNFFEKMSIATGVSVEKIIKAANLINKFVNKNEKCVTNM